MIRGKLTALSVIIFTAAVMQAAFWQEPETAVSTAAAPESSGQAEQTISYQISTAPIFGDEIERFVAHRGYSHAAPENSVPAFELAAKYGFWGVETDISESADGVFMCMHDDTLERTVGAAGAIADYTYGQLMEFNITEGANIDKYSNLKIPTMAEFLNICIMNDLVPVIEIKHITNYDAFLQMIYDSGMKNRCIVTGAISDLEQIRARDSEIELMVIGYSNIPYERYIELISEFTDHRGILYNSPSVTREVVDELHAQGIYCGVWVLDTADEAKQYMDYGVDYVVTNEIPALNMMINTNE